jgi:hypothetical protein
MTSMSEDALVLMLGKEEDIEKGICVEKGREVV